ncbi:carbonic anhydrase [Streptomyces sp. NPDC052040]|uniref:carbonic anhydrase n=1 Tax=Streptomyces sp. NPDC052040 TaxID=3365682 RepID=UPI0037D042DC
MATECRAFPKPAGPSARAPRTADDALAELLAGNRRYACGRPRHPRGEAARQHAADAGSRPFAAVLGCVDSRVPPELVFDQGLGDLLCAGTAGQVLDEAVLGSLQYGVEELRIPLVLVLGHERCGAVAATLDHLRTGAPVPGHLRLLVDEIAPAARRTRGLPGDWLDHTVRAHTAWVRDAIRADPAFGAATVAAARFDHGAGLVSLLEPPERQPGQGSSEALPAAPTPKRGAFPSAANPPAP